MKTKSKIYLQMFFSYLGILVIPMGLAMILYVYTFRVIVDQAETMNENLLVMVKNEIDFELDNIWKVLSRLALDDRIQQIANVKDTFDSEDQINLYYIYEQAESINMSEKFMDDVFILFNNTQKVVSSRGNMTSELFYHLYYENSDFSYGDFQEYMKQFHYGDVLPIKLANGDDIFLFTMGTLKSTFRDSPAVICCQVNAKTIQERFQQMKWSDSMDVMLLTQQNATVSADETIAEHYIWEYDSCEKGSYAKTNDNGEEYIVSVLLSDVTEWKYMSVMPVHRMKQSAEKVRMITIIGVFLCILAGISISYEFTKKNYNPIKLLLDNFKKHGKVEINEGENEFQWLNSQIDKFFQKHIDTESLLKKNQKHLKNYYLYLLLQESCDGSACEQYGLNIQCEQNVVILFKPILTSEKTRTLHDSIEENALQKFILMNVFQELCTERFSIEMVELGEQVAAVVSLPNPEMEQLDALKEMTETLQQMMEDHFEFQVNVLFGSICRGWEGIHDSYLQATKLEQYVHLLDSTLLLYDEVKDIQPEYKYPFDLEQKMINAIKIGNSADAWKIMEQVFQLNLSGKVTANLYCCLVYGIMGTVLEGARQGGYIDVTKDITFKADDILKMPIDEMKVQPRLFTVVPQKWQKVA